jgi:hypothetical protein
VDGIGRGRTHIARNTASGRKLAKKLQHPFLIFCDAKKMFGIGPFEINVGHQRQTPEADVLASFD